MSKGIFAWETEGLAAHARQPSGSVHKLKDEPAPVRFVYVAPPPPPKPVKPLSKTAMARATPPGRRKPNESLDAYRARTQKEPQC